MKQQRFVAKGHSIFRQQPNHSYFDKPFHDESDRLFQCLHEIDPYFLTEERKAECIDITNTILTDPRTKKPIIKTCFDYTQDEETDIFDSPRKSLMKADEHEMGVRILNLLQHRREVEEEDMYNWYRLQTLRLREKQLFQKFIFEYSQANKEKLYAPCRRLLDLYKKWYKSKSSRLLKSYPQQSYNTYLGLPQVRLCKNVLNDQQVHITNNEIVVSIGKECILQENIKTGFKEFNHALESYAQVFENSYDLKESLEDELKQRFEKIIEQAPPECSCMYIPLESLLFLVTAGDYVDLPTEMLLIIKEVQHEECESRKCIVMDLPLPARQGGWHTYEQVIEHAVSAMASIKQLKCFEKDIAETNASIKQTKSFEASTITDFMKSCDVLPDKLCTFSKSLTKWQLSATEDKINFQIYTSLEVFEKENSASVKLEYKPKFGCEILTKYRTLKEWFKLKLNGATKTDCVRLDVTNFQTLLVETLTIDKLEETLFSVYKLKLNELLNNIFEFLKMLYGMPLGHYMLRYNPKFKDKILLSKPSEEMTPNTVHLHQLINGDVTDLIFRTEQNYLPIDENLCSIMHLQHKILPSAFSPFVEVKKTKTATVLPKRKHNLIKKPESQTKKLKKSTLTQNNTESKKRMNRSKRKRANRRRRRYEVLKGKRESKEINDEIELDCLMLNNL